MKPRLGSHGGTMRARSVARLVLLDVCGIISADESIPSFAATAWSRCQRYTAWVFNDSLTFATTCTRPCSVCATRDCSLWRPCIHNIRDEARGGQQSARGGGTLERIPCFIARGNPAGAASHAVLEGWYSPSVWRVEWASAPLR